MIKDKVLALLILAVSAPVFAQTHEWSFFAGVTQYKYQETSIDMDISGQAASLGGAFTNYMSVDHLFQIEAEYNKSLNFKYDGYTQGGDKLDYPSNDYFYQLKPTFGFRGNLGPNLQSTFRLGLGYRYLHNKVKGDGAYLREQVYIFLPLGVDFIYAKDESSKIVTTLEYNHLLQGKNKTHLGDVDSRLPTLELDQDSGSGLLLNVRLEVNRFYAGIFYREWRIDESETETLEIEGDVYGFVEPKNETFETGLKIGMIY